MLKHVSASQLSPYNRVLKAGHHGHSTPAHASRPDTVSLASFGSSGGQEALSSRSSSTSSIHDTGLNHQHKTVVKIYARVLCADMEYKTVSIAQQTTSRDVVRMLLGKFRMKHRDPNLFYLTMEVAMRKTGVPIRTIMVLDEEAKPAELQACHPRGDSKFCLQMRSGGLVKIYDGCLMPGSLYKSLLVSDRTTVEELIQLLLHCYNSKEWAAKFSLFEICISQKYERRLHALDLPLAVQQEWPNPQQFAFQLKRNSEISPKRRAPWLKNMDVSGQISFRLCSRDEVCPRAIHSPTLKPSLNNFENFFYV